MVGADVVGHAVFDHGHGGGVHPDIFPQQGAGPRRGVIEIFAYPDEIFLNIRFR
jgi:hypothetical protein